MVDISVIIPLYKGNRYYNRLINMMDENLAYQRFYESCNVEVIFVNDYPEEKIVLDNESHRYVVKMILQSENRGIHASRVTGLKEAEGNYIVMLDQDDLVKENWLSSQWNKIKATQAEYCVCNGWKGRFRVLWLRELMKKRINDVQSYFVKGNPILTPGQVIIKREAIPEEWLKHIQHCNGSDDYLLWILALKKKHMFILNDDYLFFHTPDRTEDSVSLLQMQSSVEETVDILKQLEILTSDECILAEDRLRQNRSVCDIKYSQMFQIMYQWMGLKNRKIYIDTYLKRKEISRIAIYGMGYIGECLYEELERTDVKVLYGIDRSALDYEGRLPVYRIDDENLETVDAVIITVANISREWMEKVREKLKCPVYTMSDLLIDMQGV